MRERDILSLQRGRAIGIAGMAAMALLGCARTGNSAPHVRAVPMPEFGPDDGGTASPQTPRTWSFHFDAPDRIPDGVVVGFHVDLVGAPIRIWFYHQDGKVTNVRVVGHGDEAACAAASLELWRALLDPAIDGFLTYGAADLHPRNAEDQGQGFDAATQVLHQKLEHIAAEHPDDLEVRDLDGAPDTRLNTPPSLPGTPSVTYALADAIPLSDGPEFVPVRSWSPGQRPDPIEFKLTTKDLGLTEALVGRFGSQVGLRAWNDAVGLAKLLVEDAAAYRQWYASGAKLDTSKKGIEIERRSPAVSPVTRGDVERSISVARQGIDVATLLKHVLRLTAFSHGKLYSVEQQNKFVVDAKAAIDVNRSCLSALSRGVQCTTYDHVVFTAASPDEQAGLQTLVDEAKSGGEAKVSELAKMAAEEVVSAERDLANAQRSNRILGGTGRENLVDALLRAWPIATGDTRDDAAIDRIVARNVPAVWKRVLGDFKTQGIDFSGGSVGGDLVGPSIFYRVRDQGNGVFNVMPMYVVHGAFMERWSPSRHSVLIGRQLE